MSMCVLTYGITVEKLSQADLPLERIEYFVDLKEVYCTYYKEKKISLLGAAKALKIPYQGCKTIKEESDVMLKLYNKLLEDGCRMEHYWQALAREEKSTSNDFVIPPVTDVMRLKKQPYPHYIILDFEATCENNRRIMPQEIIEFPSVILSSKDLSIVDQFQVYIRPVAHPKLSKFCIELTGIQQEWVNAGATFDVAYRAYHEWLVKNKMVTSDGAQFIFITCGDWDLKTCLPGQITYSNMSVPNHFTRWINIKRSFSEFYKTKMGDMISMMDHLKLPMMGRHHSGIDDCRNITRIVQRMLQDGAVLR
eukprot:TRINITY_DN5342_c0_g1_i1.p1 TRINITY_DN5342_c0_g1~~TRINITY_DN5342_c0_g1_i1.p1  ORF type:complete len:308 (-),score=38.03 TRINITY_DN5342_c0_g1_i1:84-1007(-)